MRPATRWFTLLGLTVAIAAALHLRAHADGATCVALIGGVEASKKSSPELVLFNTASGSYTLDLTLRDADGNVIVSRDGEISVGAYQTVGIDLMEQIRRDLPKKTKPYAGLFSAEITGDTPFGPDTVLVHVTQFYGSRKNPKAAFVLPAVFRDPNAP